MSAVACLKCLTVLPLAAALGAAHAQPANDDTEAALPRYHVEIIVFANNEGDPGEEWFAHEVAKSRMEALDTVRRRTPHVVGANDALLGGNDEDAIVLDSLSIDELIWAREQAPADPNALLEDVLPGPLPGVSGDAPEGTPEGTPDEAPDGAATEMPIDDLNVEIRSADRSRGFRFRLLEQDELQLNDEYAHIARLSAYEPLVHGGWVQEGLSESAAYPFDLVYLGTTNPRGTMQLHLSRFLHVTVDLDYVATRSAPSGPRQSSFSLGEFSTTPRYALETQRRLRSGELHYIDHPMFGVIVLVTPAPEPVESESESGLRQTPAA
jgi:hypothetical protein